MSNHVKNMRAVVLMLFAVLSFTLNAQTITVSGNVVDATGEPIIGASVVEKGNTTVGTVTDFDGNFKLSVPAKATLVVSYIGMKSQEVAVKGQSKINVTLSDDTQALDEVVVIGYGTVQKKDLTGSVASVSAKQLEAVPVSSASEALTGKLAGVSITTTEGSPDADVKIRVRGGGSLSQDNSPLYIVDGFPVSSISDIAPADIQSIDVLKDASSTAIYGSQGANGVIIITTKSGKEGKVQVNFGAQVGWKKVAKTVKTMDPYNYAYYQYEMGSTSYGAYDDLDIWKSVSGNDYQDQIFGNTGLQQQYNVSVSGGSKDTKFSVSYNRANENSIMRGSGYSKDNINAKINTTLNKWLKFDFNARLTNTKVEGLGSGADANESNAANSIVANAVRFRPIDALDTTSDSEDDSNSTTRQYNPLERLDATYKVKTDFKQNYNAGLDWTPIKDLKFRTEYGYGFRRQDTDQAWASEAVQNSSLGDNGMPQAVLTRLSNKNWRNANTVTYDAKLFGKRDRLNVMLGEESSSSQDKTLTTTTTGYPSDMTIAEVLANMGLAGKTYAKNYIDFKENRLSFFGRANYTLMERFLFTVTMRADASSRFASGNRWGYFPSAAFAWRMNEEKFMQSTSDWLSNLKLRLSYGSVGNDRIPDGLMYTTYSMADASSKGPYFDESYNSQMEHTSTLSNPKLKWETTITRNLGFDFGFLNNRISGSIDAYWNTTKDLLMRAEIPSNSGYTYQYQNFGQTSNKGLELQLTAGLVQSKNFNLDFNFNIAWNKNRIDKLSTDNPWQSSSWAGSTISKYEDFRVEEGGRLGEVWGYKTNGYFTVYDEVNNPNGELVWSNGSWALRDGLKDNSTSITGGKYYPGGLKVQVDENGDPVKQRLGNTVAPINGGFGVSGNWKNFDFTAFFNYSLGNKIINGTKLATAFRAGSALGYNLNADFNLSNRYTWIDPETGLNLGTPSNSTILAYGSIEAIGSRLNEINAGANIYNPAAVTTMQLIDYAVEDASFLRVQNISVGYTLPKNFVRKLFIENVRVYFTGYNLFTFTKYTGADPEVDTSSKKNAMTPGVDYAAYPKSRSFVGGINVTF
jgi:TonB-linked SusC/RagA family outer membrane protein